jgi:rhamnosyltransferase
VIYTPPSKPTVNNTALVIVSYYPDSGFKDRLRLAAAQFPLTILVDNSGRELPELSGENLHFLRNENNLGLGTALNQGCSEALNAGFEWVVTLDQDSQLDHNFLQIMLRGWKKCEKKPAIIGSNYFSVSRNTYKIPPQYDSVPLPRVTVITSGSLMHLGYWNTLGRFREDFFIDAIDHEYCLRVRAAGLTVCLNSQPAMRHTIGAELTYSNWLRKIIPFSHPPLRNYTNARNSMRTIVENALQEPVWCLRRATGLCAEFLSIIFLEPGKITRAKSFLHGLWHGWLGKMGPVPSESNHE